MKLKDRYKEIKREYLDSVILLGSGSFIISFGMDALLLHYLFSYQIKDDKVGFPKSAFERVSCILKEKEISYIYIYKDDDNNFVSSDNQYFILLEQAQKEFNDRAVLDILLDRICFLIAKDSSNYNKIKDFIDGM